MTRAALKKALAALANPRNNASAVARRLSFTRTTLCAYVNGDGSIKESSQPFLPAEQITETRRTRKTAPASCL